MCTHSERDRVSGKDQTSNRMNYIMQICAHRDSRKEMAFCAEAVLKLSCGLVLNTVSVPKMLSSGQLNFLKSSLIQTFNLLDADI